MILSPRAYEQTLRQDVVNSDGVLYVSGSFMLKESAAKYNHIFRFTNRLIFGRGPVQSFLRVPCKIKHLLEQQAIAFSRRPDPFEDEQESDPDADTEYWYATGKLDPQNEPELVYQHLGFNSEPAVKIHYLDQQQRSK